MTLTDRQALDLEMEFLQQDLGRLPSATPAAAAKRELTRALYERATADEGVSPRPLVPAAHAAIQDTVRAVVSALDKVVTAWEASTVVSKGQPQIVDGVRTAAAFIAAAAERAGLTMPAQPKPMPAGAPTVPDEQLVEDIWPAGPAIAGPTAPMFGGM